MKIDEPYLVYIRDAIGHIEQLTPTSEEDLTTGSFTHDLAAILSLKVVILKMLQELDDQ